MIAAASLADCGYLYLGKKDSFLHDLLMNPLPQSQAEQELRYQLLVLQSSYPSAIRWNSGMQQPAINVLI